MTCMGLLSSVFKILELGGKVEGYCNVQQHEFLSLCGQVFLSLWALISSSTKQDDNIDLTGPL